MKLPKINLELTIEELKLIHNALVAQPYGKVELLVAKIRQIAVKAAQTPAEAPQP